MASKEIFIVDSTSMSSFDDWYFDLNTFGKISIDRIWHDCQFELNQELNPLYLSGCSLDDIIIFCKNCGKSPPKSISIMLTLITDPKEIEDDSELNF